jgi:hypothetical protein
VVLAAVCGFVWVAEHLIEVGIVSAVCGALAVAAVVALMRMGDRRDARHAAAGPLLYVRSEVIGGGQPQSAFGQAARRSIGPAAINLNFYGEDGEDMAARVIRTAIPEQVQIQADRL